jgi:glutamate-1-semialdehyde 2,1-aminomutase
VLSIVVLHKVTTKLFFKKMSNINPKQMNRTQSEKLFETAKTLFPGGVNSPVRAFKSVGGTPIFIEKGKGSYIWDADGNKFLDFCGSWGPLILGHAADVVLNKVKETLDNGTSFGAPTRLENELAQLVLNNHKYIEKLRFVSSGTEAVMSAVRLARGYTGKNKIIKFDGCYHGHVDSLLVNAGSGLVTLGTSSSAGIPESFVKETIVVRLNDKEALAQAIELYKNDLACVIIEPIPANNGLLLQSGEFLNYLREITAANNVMLIFDEVISGFRVGFEGAAGLYNIQPDIITFGKIIGGGLPVGAYGASAEIMSSVSPEGPVYQAGTLSGNPVAMSAGVAQLSECLKPGFYESLNEKTAKFVKLINTHAKEKDYPFNMVHLGSIFWLAFGRDGIISRADQINSANMKWFNALHKYLLHCGVYLGPSGYEVGFVSEAHTEEQLRWAATMMCDALDSVFGD